MATVAEHYQTHLAPIYLWMAGGFDSAVARGEAEIAAVLPDLPSGITAVDLGAGFGMHTIPLARRGCSVIAIDTSAILLEELRLHAGALPVTTFEDDLLSFPRHLASKAQLILCMGDTLTHLPDAQSVEMLFALVVEALSPGGTFIATFRDFTSPLVGPERFIPVRSDGERILTCFLEYDPGYVHVHDVLYERNGSAWQLRVSAYPKLRLSPEWAASTLTGLGLAVRVEPGLSGMVRIVATKI